MIRPKFIGHVHLKVSDLQRAEDFYTRVLGFKVTERVGPFVFLTAGEKHHDVALQGLGPGAPHPPQFATGLYHFALEVEDLRALADAYARLTEEGIPVSPVDHGISRALYFNDPDGNGIEIYVDTRDRRAIWGGYTEPLDIEELLTHRST